VQADAIPVVDGVHLVSGEFGGAHGPVESLTGVFMSFVDAEAGQSFTFEGLSGRDVFLYVARGSIDVGGTNVPHFTLAELGPGDRLTIAASEPAVFLFGHADPIDEPIFAHGPFVMNTEQEIRQAYADYQAGKFAVAEIAELQGPR
jgi:redox-sensitive bicupin YhaK (pirin superfamily)